MIERIYKNQKTIKQTFFLEKADYRVLFVGFTNMFMLIQLVVKLLKWETKKYMHKRVGSPFVCDKGN